MTDPRYITCQNCGGDGTVATSRYGGNDPDTWQIPCPACEGDGTVEVEDEDVSEEDIEP